VKVPCSSSASVSTADQTEVVQSFLHSAVIARMPDPAASGLDAVSSCILPHKKSNGEVKNVDRKVMALHCMFCSLSVVLQHAATRAQS